jgi:hypothetical protein
VCASTESCDQLSSGLECCIAAFKDYFRKTGETAIEFEASNIDSQCRRILKFGRNNMCGSDRKSTYTLELDVVNSSWILDSISNYELLDLGDEKFIFMKNDKD